MDKERIDELVKLMEKEFPDWEPGSYRPEVEEAINLAGEKFFDKFGSLNWQEQDQVISLLQAIRGG